MFLINPPVVENCLNKLIKCSTRVTCNSSSNLDHVLTSLPDRVSQSGVIDIGISDRQWLLP